MAFDETIPQYGEAVSNQRELVYRAVCDELLPRITAQQERPYIVGVNGVDTSGKTEFALGLKDILTEHGIHVQCVHIDDFSNPRAVRNATPNLAENYYNHCFDLEALLGQVLYPARYEGRLSSTINHIELATDERTLVRQYEAHPGSVLLVEGVFIFRPEIAPHLDYRLFLDIPVDTMMQRAAERDVPRFGAAVLDKYRDKYLPAQQRYISTVNPAGLADIVVENTDWARPVIIKQSNEEEQMAPTFFHECEVKYQLPSTEERSAVEQRVQAAGFAFEGTQTETDFLPDTEDFMCREHGILLRFRQILAEAGQDDVLVTVKVKGNATDFQEYYELEYRFSEVDDVVFGQINQILENATGKSLPPSIHEYDATRFNELITQVKSVFPAHRILLAKRRAIYKREDCHALFDTLPEGIGDYLEIEAPTPEKLRLITEELSLNPTNVEPLDYGDILKRHKSGLPDQEARTGLFDNRTS